jgi:hypothetical protein
MKYIYIIVIIILSCSLIQCEKFQLPPEPVYPDDPLIGPNGPEPATGWEAIQLSGKIDASNYYDTGGDWYIMIEYKGFKQENFTQVYLHADPNRQDNHVWILMDGIRLSDGFLYLDDPSKAYFGWTFCIFIYSRYTGEDG